MLEYIENVDISFRYRCIEPYRIGCPNIDNIDFFNTSRLSLTALHALHASRSSHENAVCLSVRPSVRPSVCLSVKRVIGDKTKESCTHIPTPLDRTFTLVLETKRMFGIGGDPFHLKFWVKVAPLE